MAQNNITIENDMTFGQTGFSLEDWQRRNPAEQDPKTMGQVVADVDNWLASVQPPVQSTIPPAIFPESPFLPLKVTVSEAETTSSPPALTNEVVEQPYSEPDPNLLPVQQGEIVDRRPIKKKAPTVIYISSDDDSDIYVEEDRAATGLPSNPTPPAPFKFNKPKLTILTKHPLAVVREIVEEPETLPPKTPIPTPKSIAPKPQLGFDWNHFYEDTNTHESRNELLSELNQTNRRIYDHVGAYSIIRDLNTEAGQLQAESFGITNDFGDIFQKIQEIVTRQQNFHVSLNNFVDRTETAAKTSLAPVPREKFLQASPQWFLAQERRRSAATLLDRPENPVASIDFPNFDTPTPPPGINPLWKSQHPYVDHQGLWRTMDSRRPEYKDYKCDLCLLIGHIKYDCPHYTCPICKRRCGHKPSNCKRSPTPAPFSVEAAHVRFHRHDEVIMHQQHIKTLEQIADEYSKEIQRRNEVANDITPRPSTSTRRPTQHAIRGTRRPSISTSNRPPAYSEAIRRPTPPVLAVPTSLPVRRRRRNRPSRNPPRQRSNSPPTFHDDPHYDDDVFDYPEGYWES